MSQHPRMWLLLCAAIAACDTVYYRDGLGVGDGDRNPDDDPSTLARSCRELLERTPGLRDGFYDIAPTTSTTRQAFCDMTRDGGGWTLLTPADVATTVDYLVDVDAQAADDGGARFTVVPLVEGCGDGLPNSQHQVIFDPGFDWSRLRARYAFAGAVNCWSIFGDAPTPYAPLLGPNVIPFELGVDAIRDQVRMGGAIDAYTGGDPARSANTRCEAGAANFWDRLNGFEERSAVVTLRRADLTQPAGIATGADCVELDPSTRWGYSDIYVR